MGQQQHDTARPLPFGLSGDNKLVDDHLGAVGKIAELRLPKTQHVRIIQGIPVIESEHGSFRKQTVIDTETCLVLGEVK